MSLSPDDRYYLNAAVGYLELGMFGEAQSELEKIAPEAGGQTEVLVVRLALFQETQRWASMQSAARKLAELDPADPQWAIAWAYATRRAESIDVARLVLIEALERHPLEALIHYNLACYDSVLKNLESSQEFLVRALTLEPGMRAMALEDPDLEPLRPWVSSLDL